MRSDPPNLSRENVIMAGAENHICDRHWDEFMQVGVNPFVAMSEMVSIALEDDEFFRIGYRKKNGYELKEDFGAEDIGANEGPGIPHINQTLDEVEPLCCWLEENLEDPYPDDDSGKLVGIVVEHAYKNEVEEE